MAKRITIILILLFVIVGFAFSQEATGGTITETMAHLVMQLGIILFAAKIGGIIAGKLKLPTVLGELLSGVAIGPFALGALPLFGFPHGLFPMGTGGLAVSPELYGFSTVASILLLFVAGLETDISLFLRYSVTGLVVGLGGVIVSFGLGDLCAVYLLGVKPGDPIALFLGILLTATSVGITARILSDQRKMDSPEGVTILAAAVIDDVLGIICLAVVMGVVTVIKGSGGSLGWGRILGIAVKAIGIWLGFTILGFLFSKQLARFLKGFKQPTAFSILSIGLALLLAGFFEMEGLAMIIGAYVVGLSLSKSDIALVIREKIHVLYVFFVPIFFAVMGMLVNVRQLLDPAVLAIGGVYTLLAVVSKIVGCGLPSMATGFNAKGALRIGLGMIPRGEVALIIAGIGLSSGILDERVFGVVIMMTLLTTIVTPPLLNLSLKIPGKGTRKAVRAAETITTEFSLPSREIADLVMDTLLRDLESEGFWIQMMDIGEGLSQVRRGDVALSIKEGEDSISIESMPEDIPFVKTAIYETLMKLDDGIERLKRDFDPKIMRQEMAERPGRVSPDILKSLKDARIIPNLLASSKKDVIEELVASLDQAKLLNDPGQTLKDVLKREDVMSTGMQHGVALPHGKTDGVDDLHVAIGISARGVDFGSLDGEPSRIFILVVSPKKTSGPHIQLLASVSSLLLDDARRLRILNAGSEDEIRRLLCGDGSKGSTAETS
jgi:Kef-type K+ transport system membrane component KefB/mannitol/fructose-specific phosphotransferase system IIA component (Ntr-type)